MDDAQIADVLRACSLDPSHARVQSIGSGDYCRAYSVNGDWIFLIARHDEGTRSLARAASLLPALVPTVTLPIPNVTFSGEAGDPARGFIGYRPINGTQLSPEIMQSLSPDAQHRCATDLARFLREVHSFPAAEAERLGIVACGYPFCATEDGMTVGPATEQFQRDLDRALACPLIDQAARNYCTRIVRQHLEDPSRGTTPPALLHGEVSADHVMFDPESQQVSGVIDFNGMIIGDPARDFLYLYEDYGLAFVSAFLRAYGVEDRAAVLRRVHFYHQWLTVLRLLWAWDHQYEPGIARRLAELLADQRQDSDPPWRSIV